MDHKTVMLIFTFNSQFYLVILFFFLIDIDVCKFNHMLPRQYENRMNLF